LSSVPSGAPPESGQQTAPLPFVWSLDRSSDVGRALLAATRRLRETGSDSPQLDSAILMAHVLGVSKGWLYAHPTRQLTPDEISRFEELVRRRMGQEPVAYLVGFKPFYGLDITVDRRVLIPRPETEILVDRVLEHLQRRAKEGDASKVADIGSGSGAIAVALAVNVPGLIVYAADISEDALAVAAQNIWRYGVGDQVQLAPGNLLDAVPEPVDVIVANLPYIASPDLANLAPQVRDFEPVLALDGGPDGLDVIRMFLAALGGPRGHQVLQPGGRVYLEIGWNQGDTARALAQGAFPGADVSVLVDYAGLDRIVLVAT
jgi:release factor glutamine methyltransferase